MDVTETLLPGVGFRYEFRTVAGTPAALVVHREGAVDLVVYDSRDPDRARSVLSLEQDEADTIGELLGMRRVAERFADLSREVPGLRSGRLTVPAGSRWDGRPLGDTRARTLTGCSVVAVVRGSEVVTSPSPAETLHAGDVLVAVGNETGLEALIDLVQG